MTTYLLLETGDFLLKEDGYKIILIFIPSSLYTFKTNPNNINFKIINPNNINLKIPNSNITIKEVQ